MEFGGVLFDEGFGLLLGGFNIRGMGGFLLYALEVGDETVQKGNPGEGHGALRG